MVYYPLETFPTIFRKACSFCTLLSKKFSLLQFLRKIWFPFYFYSSLKTNDKVCFIVYGYYIKPDYLRYLKTKYPKSRIIKLHRDGYTKWRTRNPEYSDKDILELFDKQFTFDKGDAQKYNMIHFDEIASRYDNIKIEKTSLHDIFFAGATKDRLKTIIAVYDTLSSKGVDCYFYITKCPQSERIDRPGIIYSDTSMSYNEMLYHTINSKAILEINQQDVDGYTSRFLESIMYNKKLVTNNCSIKSNKYYNPNYICCFEDATTITKSFIYSDIVVNHHYNGDYSPTSLIDNIDKYLSELDK